MRQSKLIYLLCSACLVSCTSQAPKAAFHWSFDEKDGIVASDDISSKQDTIRYIFIDKEPHSDPIRRNGVKGKSLEFDGFSSYVQRSADEFTLPQGPLSISVWVAPRAFENGDDGKLSAIVNQQDLQAKQGFCLGMFRHGKWSFQFGDGNTWFEIWDEGHPMARRQWSFLTATFNPEDGAVALYLNGEKVSEAKTGIKSIVPSSNPFIIGRHNAPAVDGRTLLSMFNGLMDELSIYPVALSAEQVAAVYKSYVKPHKGSAPLISYEEIKIDREKYRNDPYRPEMHANPPGHWQNEPHAPFFYNGMYHLTYQHNPTGPYWHNIDWGHVVSEDLVHWKDMPEVLMPEDNDVAPDGIWSGSTMFDKNGDPVIVYTFGNWNKEKNQGVALAFPKDKTDPNLTEWEPLDHTTIEQQDGQGITGEFRDPFAFRDEKTGKWYILVGSGIEGKGGTAWAYESDDMETWNLRGPFYLSNYKKYPFLGDKWELPVFLPLGQYPDGETRYVMIISPKGYLQNVEVYYWLGRFDRENCRFIPDNEEPLYWDYGGNRFIGPSGFIDPKGRALIFTVVGGNGTGWAGTCGFPSHIFLDDAGKLGVKPIEELNSLRVEKLLDAKDKSISEINALLSNVKGNMIEINLEMDVKNAAKAGISVLKSKEGEEETLFYYDAKNGKLLKDTSKSQIRPASANGRPMNFFRKSTDERENLRNAFVLSDGETLKMHLYIDKSLIQAYVNDRNTITSWAYPTLADSKGIEIFSEGADATVKSLEIWQLGSIYY